MTDLRRNLLTKWAREQLNNPQLELTSVSGDASFRRYFRLIHDDIPYIAVDAPPPHEDCRPFVAIAQAYLAAELKVPEIKALDLEQGMMLLSDFGDTLLLAELTEQSAGFLYGHALQQLPAIYSVTATEAGNLPAFDEAMLSREMALFTDWLIAKHLQLTLSDDEAQLVNEAFEFLIENAQMQPQGGVHRDYHSRNLMVCDDGLGIIDFQDAVIGPITYDAVSLLRDCYIRWPDALVYELLARWQALLVESELLAPEIDEAQFRLWFDLMGIQRHLKAAGIFARLYHRDGKEGYLADIPRTVGYIVDVAATYPQLAKFAKFVESKVLAELTPS
ncbi:serine/threonine protein kinase [Corallincola holothuriorum]|uniref:Serine/threonine protein kinase n=1 Tax=Corallincola holothuriorum TaxID=2282215 RepID=A0A368NKU8_9GAMM|nr:serine/threonine protein kinase [Corallincola holothuriorum]